MRDKDISSLLADWPYQAGRLQARLISTADGSVHLQLRLNLGIVQMFPSGRPDGTRPSGRPTYLQVCRQHLADMLGDTGAGELDHEACAQLREEFAQFYQRCVALMVLEDHMGVIRDTRHNLRIIHLCRRYAAEPGDAQSLLRFWPHAAMSLARAQALAAVEDHDPAEALAALERGIRGVRGSYVASGRRKALRRSPELKLLRSMRQRFLEHAAAADHSMDTVEQLQQQLDEALQDEKYELAIALRDQLQALERDRQP